MPSSAFVGFPSSATVTNRLQLRSFKLPCCQPFKPVLPRRQPCLRSKAPTVRASAAPEYVEDKEFKIEKISFGSILSPIGIGLLVIGFGAYFQILPGGEWAAIELVYGFPISILGLALGYAQLKPVPCRTTKEAFQLRDSQATDIQKQRSGAQCWLLLGEFVPQRRVCGTALPLTRSSTWLVQVREDVTRYRYGDEQHLEEALNRIFMLGRPNGIPRRLCPKLVGVREEAVEGQYSLVLEFESSEKLTPEMWQERLPKMQSFFGPGIVASLKQTEQGMDVSLVCDGSGEGRGGGDRKDVLPPLMPGLKARQQS